MEAKWVLQWLWEEFTIWFQLYNYKINLMVDKVKAWYTMSKRKEITFQKLYEHPYLSQI